ncbi:hypothetical protein ACN38_g4362 [Penicillium nordicum]|uniref:Uncharacterized protein n=1 Tax=Penicillium nordicum TaxID=229535 RepID=A0A0M8PAK8_9EURO|nr:hypothetical protein ACN38_g4362 [Penicillium nordicum]
MPGGRPTVYSKEEEETQFQLINQILKGGIEIGDIEDYRRVLLCHDVLHHAKQGAEPAWTRDDTFKVDLRRSSGTCADISMACEIYGPMHMISLRLRTLHN